MSLETISPTEHIMFDLFRPSAATNASGPPSTSTCACSCSSFASLDAVDSIHPLPGVDHGRAIDSGDSDKLPDVVDVFIPGGRPDDTISPVPFPLIPEEHSDSHAPSSRSTPSVHTSHCTVGKVVSFKRKLGNGTFGSVMLGEIDGQPDFVRAVKIIRKEMYMLDGPIPVTDDVSNYYHIREVRNEIKALLRVNGFSPFLPRDAFFIQDYLFYYCVMPVYPQSMAELLVQRFHAKEIMGDRFMYSMELTSALRTLHLLGIFHMDLKPDNIMIQENGHICIIDFGLSTTKRRQPRALVGTPGYCAPEASKDDDGEFDSDLADVYSYGQILVDLYLCPYPKSTFKDCVAAVEVLTSAAADRPTISEVQRHAIFEKVDWKRVGRTDYYDREYPQRALRRMLIF
ncbi:kinase-like protein [Hymenopellis radicata]|nr:kinase-like protein [Hymenopellis radicata]